MAKVMQNLWFDRDMEAALRFYTETIPGSSMGPVFALPADSPAGPANSVRIAQFTLDDQQYQAFECSRPDPFNHSFSIVLTCDTQAEIDRLWDALGEGGQIEQCGWLRDRWGLCWQIVPTALGTLMADPDRARAKRVAAAMLQMVKFDIAALHRAAEGEGA